MCGFFLKVGNIDYKIIVFKVKKRAYFVSCKMALDQLWVLTLGLYKHVFYSCGISTSSCPKTFALHKLEVFDIILGN
jgi:hypothetical protein